jgi:hypothetical protein
MQHTTTGKDTPQPKCTLNHRHQHQAIKHARGCSPARVVSLALAFLYIIHIITHNTHTHNTHTHSHTQTNTHTRASERRGGRGGVGQGGGGGERKTLVRGFVNSILNPVLVSVSPCICVCTYIYEDTYIHTHRRHTCFQTSPHQSPPQTYPHMRRPRVVCSLASVSYAEDSSSSFPRAAPSLPLALPPSLSVARSVSLSHGLFTQSLSLLVVSVFVSVSD